MAGSRQELERLLVGNPFDAQVRGDYAGVLAAEGDWEAAQRQYELLLQQRPGDAGALVGLARCLLERGDLDGARRHYLEARAKEGFTEDAALAARLEVDRARPALRVVAGQAREEPRAEVVPLSASGTVRFADIVGMEELKRTIRLRIIEPFLKPGLFARFAKKSGGGLLLYGPPGCGKTLFARAIAGECNATFVSVGISDVLNMWIGESERNLAALFEKARSQRPAVLFFDELDALAYSRSKAHS